MTKVLELARLSEAVYTGAVIQSWSLANLRSAWKGLLSEGLQAAAYRRSETEIVVAFRGTNISLKVIGAAQDLIADAALGIGMNSNYFSSAEAYVKEWLKACPSLVLCGHSLGGAVAQVVGNRLGLPFATFNAPGVAVWASRNMGQASTAALAIRTAGMAVSAVRSPIQAYKDMAAATNWVRGLNVRLSTDPVSKLGIHYGEIATIPSATTSANPLTRHGIATVIQSLNLPSGVVVAARDSSSFR